MKPNHRSLSRLLLLTFYLSLTACNMPIGVSLLSDQKSICESTGDCGDDLVGGSGALEISADKPTMAVPLEQSDSVEITGTCIDLGRKKNRIIVKVIAGDDESKEPYIDNEIGEACQASTNVVRSGLETVFINARSVLMGISQVYNFSASGGVAPYTYSLVSGAGAVNAGTGAYTSPGSNTVAVIQVADALGETSRAIVSVVNGITTNVANLDNKKCITITKGIGRVDEPGLPSEKVYPQCHNGQFGFSVRLGRALPKYLVRLKLMTDEGIVAESTWSTVTVERPLSAPVINSAIHVGAFQKCTVKASPARFNPGVLYTLNRTFTDIAQTSAGSVNLYTNGNTSALTTGASVFEWDDIGVVDGVTYNYTLTATDANFFYAVPATSSSAVVTCETKRITILPIATAVAGTCNFKLDDVSATNPTIFNPYVTYQWGYMTTGAGWVGVGANEGKVNAGFSTPGSCGNTAICTQAGLASGVPVYFALRARNLVTGEIGKWSVPATCVPN